MKCFECGKKIEDTYYKCLDNTIQINYFEYVDERDNIFCSKDCFCKHLSLEKIEADVEDEEEFKESVSRSFDNY